MDIHVAVEPTSSVASHAYDLFQPIGCGTWPSTACEHPHSTSTMYWLSHHCGTFGKEQPCHLNQLGSLNVHFLYLAAAQVAIVEILDKGLLLTSQ